MDSNERFSEDDSGNKMGKRFCEHCERIVSKRTYRQHKRMKTNHAKDSESSEREVSQSFYSDSSDLEFDFSDGELTETSKEIRDVQETCDSPSLCEDGSGGEFSNSESSDSLEDLHGETDSDVAELSFDELGASSSEGEEEVTKTTGLSTISSAVVKLIILFLFSWKTLHNLSDSALCILFAFLKRLTELLARVSQSKVIKDIANLLPNSLYMIRNYLGINREDFEKYIVCPKCSAVYKPDDCVRTLANGRKKGNRCSFIEFPNHRRRTQRKPCGASLFKVVQCKSGDLILKAKRVFCYRPVKKTLEEFLKRPGFGEKCEEFQKTPRDPELLGDIYDGRIWKTFKNAEGDPFFDSPNTFGCMLNLDWFQPYKDSIYSVGVLYLSFLNLPPQERNKEENVAIVGIIPGPNEPNRDVNSFLDPLVDELLDFWGGVWIDTSTTGPRFCRLALLCVTCDIPASRKLCGFLSFSAKLGCNKCKKEFPRPSFGEKQDFSGFNRDSWTLRTNSEHREQAWECKNATSSKKDRDEKESKYGVRFSSLMHLPYFDFISFVVIDPMHNLMLGTTKKMLKIWKEANLLGEKDFKHLQNRIDKLKVPSSIGRIPSKIASSFKGFTADQFKNWAVVFSTFALKDILPERHLQCWKLFVKACTILCSTVIPKSKVKLADELLLKFCQTVENLYGPSVITPNMHLHCHLCECILDFGPVYGFWCFSFERYNGILGSFHVNNHQIEVQLMRKFLERHQLGSISWPGEFNVFRELLSSTDKGSLALTKKNNLTPAEYKESVQLKACTAVNLFHLSFVDKHFIQALPPYKDVYMADDEVDALTKMYSCLHKEDSIVYVPKFTHQFSQLHLYNQKLDSRHSRSERSACVLARWYGRNQPDTNSLDLRPGVVQYFFKHTVTIRSLEGETVKLPYTLACVHWYKVHPHARFYFGLPIQVCLPAFEIESVSAFIPVSRIDSVCVVADLRYDLKTPNGKERVIVAVPLDVKFHV